MDIHFHKSIKHISEKNVNHIVKKFCYTSSFQIHNYDTGYASNKMLGFLADYWRLKVYGSESNGENKVLSFFIKAVSRTNAAKADMVRNLNLFKKETFFYTVLKEKMEVRDLKAWSARFVTSLEEAIVFEDLNSLHYEPRNKFERFDVPHMLRALETLARFHASSIILEENHSNILGRPYVIQKEFEQFLDRGGYTETDPWFEQCMAGALEAIVAFSKTYNSKKYVNQIRSKWTKVWYSAIALANLSDKYRNVICHRDLWNNNILFHYKNDVPDDCVFVDFQAVRCQPPAGDVMLLLYCNLDPLCREQNMDTLLNHYYNELKNILEKSNISIVNILTLSQFIESAKEQRLWALIACACLIPQFWINDELMTQIFTDTAQFDDILSKDKGSFIKNMMEVNMDYREKVMEIFEEIVERYCLRD